MALEQFMSAVISSPERWAIQEMVDEVNKWNVFVSYLEPHTQTQHNILRWVYGGCAFWVNINMANYALYKECYTGTVPNKQLGRMMQSRLINDPILVKIMDDMIRINSL